MDEPTANQFIASLVKTMQALCNGYINFSSSIEVVGHIHLNIDRKVKLDYVLTEEVSKSVSEEDATLFSSHSYHSKPPPELTPQEPAGVSESASVSNSSSTSSSSTTNRRRKSHHVPRVDDLESFSFTTVPQVTSHGQANSLAPVKADERLNVPHSDSICFSNESTSLQNNALQNSEKESRLAQTTVASSSENRRRKSSTGGFLTSAKHRRTSDVDSKPDEANNFEMIHIKQEPEDDSMMYHSSSEVVAEQDLMPSPDFSTAVMERVDPVGQKELASFRDAGQSPQMHHQPYPIMLHAGLESAASAVSLPGPSTSLAAMPSTSADCGRAKVSSSMTTLEFREYKKYSQADAARALHLVHMGLSLSASQMQTGVPMTTIFRMTKRCQEHRGNCRGAYVMPPGPRHQM